MPKALHNNIAMLNALFSVFVFAVMNPAYAADSLADWPFCHPVDRSYPSYINLDPTINNDTQPTQILADETEGQQGGNYTFNGNVTLWRGNQWMEGDKAVYNATTEHATMSGDIRLGNLNLSAHGQNGTFNLAENQGRIEDATYYLFEQHGRGTADVITFENPEFTKLKKARYTTCDEERNDWYIHARYVSLNKATGIGTAAPVYITFYHVPILFSPYLSFPIDDRRKSGFLFPSFGRSTESGSEIAAPYYLNLAPNYDATITPIFMSRRGVMFDSEFRYLTETSSGEIQATYLSNDEVYDKDRSLYAIQHRGQPSEHWSTSLEAKYVSDQDYLDDFGNNINISSETHLKQHAELRYAAGHTSATFLLQGYQTLDKEIPEAQRPYRRLPQITFNHWESLWQDKFNAEIDAEYVHFDRTDRLIAHRLDTTPSLSLPLEHEAGFFNPKISVRHTQYELDDTSPGQASSHARTIPRASIDTGIFLERNTQLFGSDYTQTLEPRLFYTHTPYEEQSEIPRFDTGLSTFSNSYLFLEDRFNGADRVGDTEHITVSLTSRFIDNDDGTERLRGSVGQIFYLKNRRVGLGGDQLDEVSQSDIVAEATAQVAKHLSSRAEFIWNHQEDEIDKGSFRLTYNAGPKRYLSANYYWNRSASKSEQTDVAISWPLSARWHFVGRHLFAHRQTRTMEAIAGLEYNSCCWGLSILHRRHQLAETDDHKESIMVQLHLKGLASIGNPIENTINENILGQSTQ